MLKQQQQLQPLRKKQDLQLTKEQGNLQRRYFEKGGICQTCHKSCKSCSGGTELDCQTCADLRKQVPHKNQCLCQDGYYQDSNFNCQKCHYSCMTCFNDNNQNSCTSCPPTSNRIQQPPLGQAKFSLVNAILSVAKAYQTRIIVLHVMRQKETCSKYTTGDSCDQSLFFILDSSNRCICKDGYYEDCGVCTQYHYSCEKCNGPRSNNCTSCTQSKNRILQQNQCLFKIHIMIISLPGQVKSSCICQNKFFDIQNQQICGKCNPQCSQCLLNQNNCPSCDEMTRTFKDNQCICKQGYYYIDVNDASCEQCMNKCETCQSEQNQNNICLTCRATDYRTLQNSQCLCKQGYFGSKPQSTTICNKCQPKCLTCSKETTCDS
ncbi:hypothetical protein ABPG72_006916 [Tetrahymena utriculariae]